MSRHLIVVGVIVVGIGSWLVVRSLGDDTSTAPAPSAAATPAERTTGADGRAPIVRTPYWERKAKAANAAEPETEADRAIAARELPMLPEQPVKPGQAGTTDARRGATSLRSPGGSTLTQPQIDRAIARIEATSGPLSKNERIAVEKQLRQSRKPPVERVPGMNRAREHMLEQTCTGPGAQERYTKLSDADKQKMQKRCAKFGFKPTL